MAKRVARRRPSLYAAPRENPIVGLFRILAIVCASYFAAAFFDAILVSLSELPHGPLWDPSFQGPVFFVLMLLVCGVMSIPFFMKEWDPSLRSFSMYTVVFLIGYAVFDGSGFIDPAWPMKWFVAHVVSPIQAKLTP